jgi:F420-dependent oxidoreductase-like protein
VKDLVIGVHILSRDPLGLVDGIVKAETAGVDVAWLTVGGVAPDPFAIFTAAALKTERIELGTSILPTFPRHPLTMAQGAMVVDRFAPGRLRLGIGPSHKPAIEGTWGLDFTRPLEHLREYLQILNPLLKEGKVSFHGKRLHAEAQLPQPTQVRVMISALRHNAFALAGELADGGISWVTPPSHIREVAVPALKEGAAKAGRDAVPPAVVHVPVAVSENADAVFEAATAQMGFYQRLPFYRAMWIEAGFPEAEGPEFTRRMCDALVVSGNEQQVAERLRQLPSFGAGEIIAMPLLVKDDPNAQERTVRLMGDLAQAD